MEAVGELQPFAVKLEAQRRARVVRIEDDRMPAPDDPLSAGEAKRRARMKRAAFEEAFEALSGRLERKAQDVEAVVDKAREGPPGARPGGFGGPRPAAPRPAGAGSGYGGGVWRKRLLLELEKGTGD